MKLSMNISIWVYLFIATLLPSMSISADSANAEKVRVRNGNNFTVKIGSNPTTGYSWRLAGPIDKTHIKFIGSSFEVSRKDLAGAPGKEILSFKAVRKGTSIIRLEYVRPWEKGIPPVKTKIYSIHID